MPKTSAIRVRTRFESIDDFVVGYSPFFDAKGIFIRTRRVQDVGTRMRFELQLADGNAVFRGEGVVDEVREPPMSASGMHLRISRLDRSSKELFERITSDTDYISQDPFEAPTYDPDKPNVVMAGAAARVLDAASQGSQVVGGRQVEESPAPEPAPTRSPRATADEADSPLDASVLDEIADGIELSLDAVWSAGDGPGGGAADLGGYFGSPQALEEAGLTPSGGVPAIESQPPRAAEPPPASEPPPPFESGSGLPIDPELPRSQPHAAVSAHSGEALALGPEDPFHLGSPGADEVADGDEALEFLDEDEIEDDEPIIDGELFEGDAGMADTLAASEDADDSDLFASADYDIAPSLEGEDLLGVSMESVAVEGDNDLGIDHSLALASAYSPPDENDDELLIGSDEVVAVGEPRRAGAVEAEAAGPEPAPPAEAPTPKPQREDGPDLRSLATATLEHMPIEDEETHQRYVFGTNEQPALGNLIHDLIDDDEGDDDDTPGLDLSLLSGEHEPADESEGPDAIDELLARESVTEERDQKKPGFFKRLFGKKK